MKAQKPFHHAFRIDYEGITSTLITDIHVAVPSENEPGAEAPFVKVQGIWDTGATGTVITPTLVKKLGLESTGAAEVFGVNSVEIADTYYLDIILPNRVLIQMVRVLECEINSGDCEMLIGMDLIQMGDFAISNGNNKTVFTFCIPPHNNPIDLLEKSNRVNKR